jgi:hypothetical protein
LRVILSKWKRSIITHQSLTLVLSFN